MKSKEYHNYTQKTIAMLKTGKVIAFCKCGHMTDTGKPRLKNHHCKGNAIICSHAEIGETASEFMTTKKCNPANCKYFSADTRPLNLDDLKSINAESGSSK